MIRTRAILALLFLAAVPLKAASILTFSGLQDGEQVLGFYGGGTGSLGHLYFNYGVTFLPGAVAFSDSDFGGTGNFANAPSPFAALFTTIGLLTFNVPDGFTEALTFYYVTNAGGGTGSASVFSGLNGTGTQLGTATLNPPNRNCPGDPNGGFTGCWQPVTIPLATTARSAVFTIDPFSFGIDNIGLTLPVIEQLNVVISPVPEPESWALMGLGTLWLWGQRRRLSL